MTTHRIIIYCLLSITAIRFVALGGNWSTCYDKYFYLLDIPSQQKKSIETNISDNRITPKINKQAVKQLIKQEFNNFFYLEEKAGISPSFLIGDTNGDGIDDIVAIVHVRGMIDESSITKPSFWLGKPLGTGMNSKAYKDHYFTIGDLSRYKGEPILVIIHGSGKASKKREHPYYKYALLDAMDNGVNKMSFQRTPLTASTITNEREAKLPPKLIGAAVLLTLDNSGTAIYWDGERYRWYPVN